MLNRNVTIGLGVCLAAVSMTGCTSMPRKGSSDERRMNYQVNRLKEPIVIDGNWDKPTWRETTPLEMHYYAGDKPEHSPKVQAKLRYDDDSIYVIWRVEDQYVRAVAAEHQGPVCKDSCVEFFFTPDPEVEGGYFNLEMNCGGTMLFHFATLPRKGSPIAPEDIARIEVAHSLPKRVDPEIQTPTTWTVEYKIPLTILPKYFPKAVKPSPGVIWRANFYKCGDQTSHPHWLTWSYVDSPKPDFHVPKWFGTIEFR